MGIYLQLKPQKMNLEQRLEELQKEIDSIKKELSCVKVDVKPKFEVDKWYYGIKSDGDWFLFRYTKTVKCEGYNRIYYSILLEKDRYTENDYIANTQMENDSRLATPEEVKEALVKEAEKRGFKEGVRVDRVNLPCCEGISQVVTLNKVEFTYECYNNDVLECGGRAIYEKGTWAEIITKPKVMIGEYEVLVYAHDKTFYTVNGTIFSKSLINSVKDVLMYNPDSIKSLNVGCNGQYKIDLDKINEILAM